MSTDSWNPDQYEKFKKEREQPFHDLMSLVRPAPFQQTIDLGCGAGEMTALFHKKFNCLRTLGMDNSQNMLDKAQAFSTKSLSFNLGKIENFRDENRFDAIISNAAIQWVPNHQQVFKNIYDSLVSGGQMCVQMPFNHDYPTHTLAEKLSPTGESFLDMKSLSEYSHLLYSLGFSEQDCFVRVYGHVLESRESVIEWVKGTTLLRFKNKLPTHDYEVFLKLYREKLFEALPDERPFYYPFKRIFLWARK